MPSLVVRMLRHGRLGDGLSVLDLGTGSGGLTAYAARRFGDQHVTSLDVDSHLTRAAGDRLAQLGIFPHFVTADATEHVPGTYERIVSTVGLPAGPGLRPVLAALAPGGRIATTLGRTCLIVTGWKQTNGDVVGRVESDMAGFMVTRSGDDYPPELTELLTAARSAEGEEVSTGRYPVVDVANAWELRSMLEITVPGVESPTKKSTTRPELRASSIRTGHGRAHPPSGPTRRKCTRAGPGSCGPPWNASATASTWRARCLCSGHRFASRGMGCAASPVVDGAHPLVMTGSSGLLVWR
ncbi:protein-L-isoaspartate O-methyltransferase [Streptomyces sp. NPDC088251]|uniref:protein-L-isoaspartate O-methyltransferase family protein n=1 Tax=unclassified Streptomyces TaxID=2593676 RepID=UPI0038089566